MILSESRYALFSPPFEDSASDLIAKILRGRNISLEELAQLLLVSSEAVTTLLNQLMESPLRWEQLHLKDQQLLERLAKLLQLSLPHIKAMLRSDWIEPNPNPSFLPSLHLLRFQTYVGNMQVNSYLLWQKQYAVAIDTGATAQPLLEALEKYQLSLDKILLTHTHQDHCTALPTLLKKSQATVYLGAQEASQLPPLPPGSHIELLNEISTISSNNTIPLLNNEGHPSYQITPYATPGHSPGGYSFLVEQKHHVNQESDLSLKPSHNTTSNCGSDSASTLSSGLIFVGDALFARSFGKVGPQEYNAALTAIREKILSQPQATWIAPGHGPMSTVGMELAYHPLFIHKASAAKI